MQRLATLALLVFALAACHRDAWHWITPIPPLPSVAPTMKPEPSLMPTVTPTPGASYPCHRWRVWQCELEFETGTL